MVQKIIFHDKKIQDIDPRCINLAIFFTFDKEYLVNIPFKHHIRFAIFVSEHLPYLS